MTLQTVSADETQAVAARLAVLLRPGDVLTLSGDLGAGKTTFTRGLVAALGVPAQAVTSPTFTLLHEYRGGRLPVYHADAYRLTQTTDADDIGLTEVIDTGDGVAVVEWAERIIAALPAERLEIMLEDTASDDSRAVTLTGRGERWATLTQEWNATC
ncbi:MAG: tRNA (adenosine(37)-N6)-threonylcarbamoyltransferase complex ATPase subunit type 1 TsaE [Akkermansiaceae bacterium]|nr:tRNA (adenosine(37)-N6)-threonylcarbamoyltransferase complex ATPase subunit type 1 TsaE [Armatimonadota bacterium]